MRVGWLIHRNKRLKCIQRLFFQSENDEPFSFQNANTLASEQNPFIIRMLNVMSQ